MQCVFLFGLEVVVLTRIPWFRGFILLGCGLAIVGTVACNAGSSNTPTPQVTPSLIPTSIPVATPTPTATSAPTASPTPSPASAPSPNPASLAFFGTGSSLAQTVTVTETGYSGTFVATTSTCGTIAGIAGTGPFAITPLAAGACQYTFTDSGGRSAVLTLSITTTTGGGS